MHHVHGMRSAEGNNGFYFDAGLFHRNEQKRNAFLLFACIAGSSQAENPVGNMRQCRPDLCTVDGVEPTVLGQFGLGL